MPLFTSVTLNLYRCSETPTDFTYSSHEVNISSVNTFPFALFAAAAGDDTYRSEDSTVEVTCLCGPLHPSQGCICIAFRIFDFSL